MKFLKSSYALKGKSLCEWLTSAWFSAQFVFNCTRAQRNSLNRWQNSCRCFCLIIIFFFVVYIFKDNPLFRHAGPGALTCVGLRLLFAGRYRHPGRWKSFQQWSLENLQPGSSGTEEWALWALCTGGGRVARNPILNSTRNVSFAVTRTDVLACASSAMTWEGWGFQTVQISQSAQKRSTRAETEIRCPRSHFVFPSHTLPSSYLAASVLWAEFVIFRWLHPKTKTRLDVFFPNLLEPISTVLLLNKVAQNQKRIWNEFNIVSEISVQLSSENGTVTAVLGWNPA